MVTLVGCGVRGIDLLDISIYKGSVKFSLKGLVGLLALGLGLL